MCVTSVGNSSLNSTPLQEAKNLPREPTAKKGDKDLPMGKAHFMFWRIKLATSGVPSGIWSGMSCGIRDIAPSSDFLTPKEI